MNILNEINKIIQKDYPQVNKKIIPKTKFKDIPEIDSLGLATMVIELETICNVRIDDNKLMELQNETVEDLINEIEKLSKK